MCISLGCRGKLESPEKTHTDMEQWQITYRQWCWPGFNICPHQCYNEMTLNKAMLFEDLLYMIHTFSMSDQDVLHWSSKSLIFLITPNFFLQFRSQHQSGSLNIAKPSTQICWYGHMECCLCKILTTEKKWFQSISNSTFTLWVTFYTQV